MRIRSRWPELQGAIRDLSPGSFALVMATGIVSRGVSLDGAVHLSGVLLGIGIVAYVLLMAAYLWRFLGYRREFLADAADPRRAFAFFTFVAGSNVLAARLAGDGHTRTAITLLAIAGAAWLLLNYGTPLLLAGRHGAHPALAGANGTWFLWVVGTQSIAVAVTSLPQPASSARVALAVCCWAVGVMLYLLIATMVASALLQYPVRPAELTPPYWVFMGATAISVLAGGEILQFRHDPLGVGVSSVVAGASVVLWAFGTWLIPLLLAIGLWRHVLRRVPLRYEAGLWSIVFPIGMYGVASRQLGVALRVHWLVTLGRIDAWVALAAWAAVAAFMAATPLLLLRRPVSESVG